MVIVRSLFALAFASVLIATAPPVLMAQKQDEPPPTDAEFIKQIERLDQKNSEAVRLKAANWLDLHSKAKNAHLAVDALTKTIRTDPAAKVRDAAVTSLALIASNWKQVCPLAVVEAMLDKDQVVTQSADVAASLFTTFAPGSIDILLRCAESEDHVCRVGCLYHLGQVGKDNQKVLEVLDKATRDKKFMIRHNANVALFTANGDLPKYLEYIIRLHGDPDGVIGQVDKDSEEGKRDVAIRGLATIATALLIIDWSNERSEELGRGLLKLLESNSPLVRGGAARLIGLTAVKFDRPKFENSGWDKLFDNWQSAFTRKGAEKSKVANYLETRNVEDRLCRLGDNDPDTMVHASAAVALLRLAVLRKNAGEIAPEKNAPDAKANKVELKSVKYDEYANEIKSAKGKVIVVYFWASYSPPDKKLFADVVKLHERFAKEGAVVISVSVDEDDKESKEQIMKFLIAQKAIFKNFILNEEPAVWQEKIKITALPAVVLFGRDGKQVRKFDPTEGQVRIGDVEKVLQELVKKKMTQGETK